jgi:polyol transport system permease protein
MARQVTATRTWVTTLAAWVVGFVIFFPILWMVLASFKTELEAFAIPPSFLFFDWTTENYATVQERSNYVHHAVNSIIIAGGSTLIAMLIAIPAAWSMAFAPTRRTRDILLWMLSTKMMPPVGVLVPIYLIFRNFGLLDSRVGLLLVLCLGNLPIVVWMLFTYFKEIPKDILEACRMDGATVGRELVYVLTPHGGAGHRFDVPPQCDPGLERGLLDAEPLHVGGSAAHRVHRVLFESGGAVLGEAFRGLDASHRADPRARLVQPAAARSRAHVRRRQVKQDRHREGQHGPHHPRRRPQGVRVASHYQGRRS